MTQLGATEQQPAARQAHAAAVASMQQAYAAIPPGGTIRLAKRTLNLFRFRDAGPTAGLDVSAFGRVICVDPDTRTAVVGGMTTYEHLADATLRHGLMPLVVPQLKTITLGGAVSGLGIEFDLAAQWPAARVGAGHGDPHRRWPGGDGHRGQRARRPVPRLPRTPTARWATRCR